MASLALEEYRRKLRQLAHVEEELDELRQRMDGRVTSSYSAVKAHSGDGRGVEARAIQLADTATLYNDLLGELAVLRLEAEAELALVEDDLTREVLTGYFIDGMTAKGIAVKTGRTQRHIYKVKTAGINKLKGMVNDDKRSDQKET